MDFGLGKIMKAQDDALGKAMKDQNTHLRKAMQSQDKAMSKALNTSLKQEGRIRIPAKRRHEVEDKYNHKCAVCKTKPCKLQVHHKNMKNNDNRLLNLELLCPNHHIARHQKAFRKRYVSRDMFGRTSVKTRLTTKKRNKELNRIKARKKKSQNPMNLNFYSVLNK